MKYLIRLTLNILVSILFIVDVSGQVKVINNPEWGEWQDQEKSPVSFELVQTFGTDFPDESAVFSSPRGIRGIDTDDRGNVFVLDYGAEMLIKFSPMGEVIWKVNQRGRGPGDLQNPGSLAVSDFVYITNLIGTRLDVFSKDGEYIQTVNLDDLKKVEQTIIGIIEGRYLALKSQILGKIGIQISVLDLEKDFKLVSQFEAVEETEFDIPQDERFISNASLIDDLIVVTKAFSYGFKYYKLDGKVVKEVNRNFPRYMRPGFSSTGEDAMMISLSKVYPPYKISNGYLLNFINWPSRIDNSDAAVREMSNRNFPELGTHCSLDLYSPQGKLLFSKEDVGVVPDIGWIKHTDEEGNLYAVVGLPYPQIKKYNIKIKK